MTDLGLTLMLSRLQFAVTIMYHFLFVPLTIGLVILVAYMETKYARTNDDEYRRMADFWGKLFTINFVLGVVTGITMEFQFGTNWSEYAKYMGDIFGSPLAIEALVAFFLESTFIGLWIFGRDRFSRKIRAFSIWMVAIGTNLSALWIITADGFMQHPVGYVLRNNRAELASFTDVVTNSYVWYMFFHTIIGSYLAGAFFIMAISAYHLRKKQHVEFFRHSFKIALVFGLFAATLTPFIGHAHGVNTAKVQPAKAAAMEAVWETQTAMPFHILQIPDSNNQKNAIEGLSIPYLGSLLYTNNPNGAVTGLKDIPFDERPNVPVVFWSFRLMVLIGLYLLFVTWYGFYLERKDKLVNSPKYLKVISYSLLIPHIAIFAGWGVAEMGRQPWIVYGLMKTADAVSPIALSQVMFSIIGLTLFYGILITADVFLLKKYAQAGPEPANSDRTSKPSVLHSSDLSA